MRPAATIILASTLIAQSYAVYASSERKQIASEAEQVVQSVTKTRYQHKAHIDPAAGIYYVDCSGLVGYVLQQAAPEQLAKVPKEDFWPCPRAFKYYEFFSSLPTAPGGDWRQIALLKDARKGDIIAWNLGTEIRKDHDTGHVMIVDEKPKELPDGSYSVKVIDSSLLKHYDDTRITDGEFHDGVGEGSIRFKVDAQGHPIAFKFGPGDREHTHDIAIGRAEQPED